MSQVKRGVQNIRTMGALLDNRRTRSPAGALLELSAMANEKLLLQKELERWTRRHAEIQERLAEIRSKEERLLRMANLDGPSRDPAAAALAEGREVFYVAGQRRVRTREWNY